MQSGSMVFFFFFAEQSTMGTFSPLAVFLGLKQVFCPLAAAVAFTEDEHEH